MPKGNEAKVELGLLKVFDALVAEGSVTRASRRLRLSQPAVSKALGRLRRSFSDPLFVRTGTGLVLTARARSLQVPVQRLLADAESLWGTPKEAYDPGADGGAFTMACSDAETVMLPHLIQRLAEEAPRATLRVRALPQDTLKALESFAVDVAIRPEIAPVQAVRRRVLYRKRFRCMARQGHRALAGGLTLEAYARASHVFVSIGEPGGRSVVTEALAARRVERHIAVTVPSFFEAAVLVSQTDLLCTAPASFAEAMARILPVQLDAPPVEIPEIEICLLWHEARDAEPRQRYFRELLLRASRAVLR